MKIKETIENKAIQFDSELELNYYKYLLVLKKSGEVVEFIYHPQALQILNNNKYTPDFIVEFKDEIKIIETKGYNQFSFQRDNMIHNIMLSKSEDELRTYVSSNGFTSDKKASYQKIKYLKGFGFVDFNFKNPNTLSNHRKNKILELEAEVKALRKEIKEWGKYYKLAHKDKKLTTKEVEFMKEFIKSKENLLKLNTTY